MEYSRNCDYLTQTNKKITEAMNESKFYLYKHEYIISTKKLIGILINKKMI